MTVLVLTRDDDLTADMVVAHLNRRGAHIVRTDLADFPASLRVAGRLTGGWSGVLRARHRDVNLEEVRAVYYRRPGPFAFPEDMDGVIRDWCAAEARHGLGGILAALPHARWINPVDRIASAQRKPLQLAEATQSGLTVPDTLITNDPAEARAFIAAQPNGAVYKSLRGAPAGQRAALYTTPVTVEDITDDVSMTAHLFQGRVPKLADVRVTQVAGRLFTVRIDSTTDAAAQDFRADYGNLTYTVIDPPPEAADGLRTLTRSLGLVYAAHDFIIDHTGRWVYLETNPGGQWAWMTCVANDVAAALADELIGETT